MRGLGVDLAWSSVIFLDRSLFLPGHPARSSEPARQAITRARTLSVLAAFSERDLFMDNDRHRLWAPADICSRVAFSCQSFLNKACHLKMARARAPLFYLILFLSLAAGPAPASFFSPSFPCLRASRTSSRPHLLSHPAPICLLSSSEDQGAWQLPSILSKAATSPVVFRMRIQASREVLLLQQQKGSVS